MKFGSVLIMTEENTPHSGGEDIGDLGRIDVSGISMTNVASPFRPDNPKMAEFKETAPGSGQWFARSGGPPKSDWSGIDKSRTMPNKNTMQLRSFNPAHEQKVHAKRVEGLTVKFKQGHSLPEFYDAVIRKLKGFGLDTIAYARDVQNPASKPTVMVIKNHARYTPNLEHNIEEINKFAESHFDDFDSLNNNDALEFLYDSIDDQLRINLQRLADPSDCFVSVWLRLMDQIVSASSTHHEEIRQSVRRDYPKNYPGENIKLCCESIKDKLEELERADEFSPALILTVLGNLAEVSVTGSFPFNILNKRNEVKLTLDKFLGLTNEEINKELLKAKLDYASVLKYAIKEYNDLLKDKKWPPALSPSDSSTSTLAGLHHAATSEVLTKDSVLALIQKAVWANKGWKGGKGGPCFRCGSTDHQIRDCPEKSNKSDSNNNKSGQKNWKRVAPKTGESETKKVGKRTFYWCAKCNRWSTTHSTATHVKKQDSYVTPVATQDGIEKSTNLMFNPGAWCMSIDPVTECANMRSDNESFPFSSGFTIGYFMVTYLFMVFYLVRNDLFRLSTICSNIGIFSLMQSFLTLLNNFGGFWNIASLLQSSVSSYFYHLSDWLGPACAPLLWFMLGLLALRLSRNDTVTTVDLIGSRMNRRDRRANEKYQKRSLKQQLKKFRASPRLPCRIHGKFQGHYRKAPTCSYRQHRD